MPINRHTLFVTTCSILNRFDRNLRNSLPPYTLLQRRDLGISLALDNKRHDDERLHNILRVILALIVTLSAYTTQWMDESMLEDEFRLSDGRRNQT